MNKLKAWIIAGRFFAAPWILVNTLLGVKLAGFDFKAWVLSFVIVFSALLGCHYLNAWRDYVKGFDQFENGSKVKPYTAASQVLPRGQLTLGEVKLSTFAFFALSIVLFLLFAPKRPDTIALFLLGIYVAITYTDLWKPKGKPKGFGEISLFLGHGFGACTFAYSLVKPVDLTALSAGTLLGLWAAMAYTLDQLPDAETDFSKKAKDLAYMMLKAQIKPSSYVWFSGSAISTLTVVFVILGLLPAKFLSSLCILPLLHVTGIIIDCNFDKGVLLFLVAMWLYVLIPAILI